MDLDVKKTMTLSSKFVSRKICEHLSSIEKQNNRSIHYTAVLRKIVKLKEQPNTEKKEKYKCI